MQTEITTIPSSSAEVITRVTDVPGGALLSDEGGMLALPEERRTDFAIIAGTGNLVTLLVSTEANGRPAMFDVRSRIIKAGMHPVVRVTTREILRLLQERMHTNVIDLQADATDVERLVGVIIGHAMERKASDIHIETRDDHADILFRVNGHREFYGNLAKSTARSLGTVLYAVHADSGSKDVVWNDQDVTDSAIEWPLADGRVLQLRFSSAPIYPAGNFHIVIRLLVMEAEVAQLKTLGYNPKKLNLLDVMSSGSNGMVIVCGPTGSGKSTTLQSLLGRIYERRGKEIKIITVEEPVEYLIPGACQIAVARRRNTMKDDASGSVFTTFLRGTLRQDPDVVMIGEIRDQETALIARDLVLSGRKVFTTLHTYSALWAFVRLREIGLPWEVLTMPEFVSGIVYQRLLPRLCPRCSVPIAKSDLAETSPETLHRLAHVVDLVESNIRVRGVGCEECTNTGIVGRVVVSEFVQPDRHLLQLLAAERFMEAENHWKRTSVGYSCDEPLLGRPATVLQDAIMKMSRGLVSPIDIENHIGALVLESQGDERAVGESWSGRGFQP